MKLYHSIMLHYKIEMSNLHGRKLFDVCENDITLCETPNFWRDKAFELDKNIADKIRRYTTKWKTIYFMVYSLYYPCKAVNSYITNLLWKDVLNDNLYKIYEHLDPSISSKELYYSTFREDQNIILLTSFDPMNLNLQKLDDKEIRKLNPYQLGKYIYSAMLPKNEELWKDMCYKHYHKDFIEVFHNLKQNYYNIYIHLNALINICKSRQTIRENTIWGSFLNSYSYREKLESIGFPYNDLESIMNFATRNIEIRSEHNYEKVRYLYHLILKIVRIDIYQEEWIDDLINHKMRLLTVLPSKVFVLYDNHVYPPTLPLEKKENVKEIEIFIRKQRDIEPNKYTISDINNIISLNI